MDLASFKQLSKAKMTGTLQGVPGLRIAGNKIDLIKRWEEHLKTRVCFTALHFTRFSLNKRRPRNNQRLRSPLEIPSPENRITQLASLEWQRPESRRK
jgi:hypothetical protein